MKMIAKPVLAVVLALAGPAIAQDVEVPDWDGVIAPVSGFTGEMSMTMETEVPEDMAVEEVIRFEPWQMLDDLFRSDIVFLMRGGPSDWDVADAVDTAPQDCTNQRLLSETGQDHMRQFGALMVVNDIRPSRVLMSEWCRAQQTYLGLETGMMDADPQAMANLNTDLMPSLNPLGAANGVSDVEELRQAILDWDGSNNEGPLLIITHFDNIAALTNFRVYEGEMLILDPAREGRVLGYLRLGSSTPDSVRFPPDVVEFAQTQAAVKDDN